VTSIRAEILDNLKSELEKIDGGEPFHHDIKNNGGVQFLKQQGQKFETLPTITIYWTDDTNDETATATGPRLYRSLHVVIDGHLETAAGSTTGEQIEQIVEDIERAVLADPTRGLGGNVDTKILSSGMVRVVEGQPMVGGHVDLRVTYRHQEADPAAE